MLIRIILRTIPLLCVAAFALAVGLEQDRPGPAQGVAGAETRQLAWGAGQVRCVDPWGNLPLSACSSAEPARNPPPPH
ncbi:hypothetical protein NM680_00485 [Paracoccus sp. PS-1]|uniref:hypothetical protein n=1 Tax=unclassified Paracoccus (in: a-proteobacteria) TaxID=2688777 RepID=UPI00048B01DF|nr:MULTISPECIES: hypothetical protein [unclassified Paracoccus (in: a-proteobacteria)]MDQ7260268.1 hypothetical protein [Paracoccus sp. PS1]RQP06336.1 MAG: hypothetical protein D1H97_08185 [Paracoccus sp. BP8]UFM66181.1 hypothetical protein LOS78_09545 [Paracoccus sp. MA]